MSHNPLGQQTEYVSEYAPQLLFPITRAESRKHLLITDVLPFYGVDIWTGYELSWLNLSGKPQVAVAEFRIPCDSKYIIESKSFKLYLNSFNQTRFASQKDVLVVLERDLSAIANATVEVQLLPITHGHPSGHYLEFIAQPTAIELDELDVSIDTYHPSPELLMTGSAIAEEVLVSHLLKTNCPVTGQPDWASVFISYKGNQILHDNLLRYLISFREHQDFHEHCVERIFCDILRECKPQSLSVYARYTRRGGLDINPFRSSNEHDKPFDMRLIRQ
ncbi:NADPH-dependent 7-cyano-7-deazaguanine reductase QueF [Cellvibrio sp. pealriver]|uniref:NADPH-dependent 7-cyano-7-deazaguanine reductase QueF n=1 Tax=Cellvibrio sp. pealriver TaxID=1622269 RepID=UPI000A6D34FA|nr:NADPH-dependent 7-cyano-7-deazaguanine reductase QueF [Cellvibrio sp. pealriver]